MTTGLRQTDRQADYNNAADQATDLELELENILCSSALPYSNTMEKIELACSPPARATLFSQSCRDV